MNNDLRTIHTEVEARASGRVIAGVVVVLAILAIGAYGYESGAFHSTTSAVSFNDMPQAQPLHTTPNNG